MKLKNNIRLLITCDSGAGAGKTTASKYLSKKYGLNLLTSGLLYRFVAARLLAGKKTINDNYFLKKITKNIKKNNLTVAVDYGHGIITTGISRLLENK